MVPFSVLPSGLAELLLGQVPAGIEDQVRALRDLPPPSSIRTWFLLFGVIMGGSTAAARWLLAKRLRERAALRRMRGELQAKLDPADWALLDRLTEPLSPGSL